MQEELDRSQGGRFCSKCNQIFGELRTGRHKWWHDIQGLKQSANEGCRLCKLVQVCLDYECRSDSIEALELWNARLTYYASGSDGGHTIWFSYPTDDPRPEPDLPPEYYDTATSICLQIVGDTDKLRTRSSCDSNTGSDGTVEKIKSWLDICSKHEVCNRWRDIIKTSSSLPSRLIEINSTEGGPVVRLVLTNELSPSQITYTTLSHRWGGHSFTSLTNHSFESFRAHIDWKSLPRTFQDAISTVSRLGFRYIWIDALCIIQDDAEDWAVEAADMCNVYANSSLNISADHSENGDEGLYRDHDPQYVSTFLVKNCDTVYMCYRNTWSENVEYSPLNKRAWVVQERFLAPRVVHFAEHQVHYECSQSATIESLPDSFEIGYGTSTTMKALPQERRSTLLNRTMPQEDLFDIWEKLLYTYTSSNLTYSTDRPIAIAGLAQTFCGLLGLSPSDYIHGLWRPRLAHELMWHSVGFDMVPRELGGNKFPSWSWLSTLGGITPPSSAGMNRPFAIREAVPRILTLDVGSYLPPSSIRMSAWLCKAQISRSGAPLNSKFCNGAHELDHVIKIDGAMFKEVESFMLFWDDEDEQQIEDNLESPLFLMLGKVLEDRKDVTDHGDDAERATQQEAETEIQGRNAIFYGCIVLTPAVGKQAFRRVGYVEFGGPGSFYWIHQESEEVEARWRREKMLLDQAFLADDVPPHLSTEMDEQRRYAFTFV